MVFMIERKRRGLSIAQKAELSNGNPSNLAPTVLLRLRQSFQHRKSVDEADLR